VELHSQFESEFAELIFVYLYRIYDQQRGQGSGVRGVQKDSRPFGVSAELNVEA